MNARPGALPSGSCIHERPEVFRYWGAMLVVFSLGTWLLAISAGRMVAQYL